MKWDREVDVLIFGAGMGGMCAALFASLEGLDGIQGKMQGGDMWMMSIHGTVSASSASSVTISTNGG